MLEKFESFLVNGSRLSDEDIRKVEEYIELLNKKI